MHKYVDLCVRAPHSTYAGYNFQLICNILCIYVMHITDSVCITYVTIFNVNRIKEYIYERLSTETGLYVLVCM